MNDSTTVRSGFAWPALVCAAAGVALFQFFGNANRGYVDTASLFYWWVSQWNDKASESEHGWLVLALSVGLLWHNLRQSGRTAKAEEGEVGFPRAALAALAGGLALHALGFVGQQARVSILGFLLFTWGALRLGGGRRWGAAALFPVGFMVFAIPVNVLDSIGFWLRLWVIDASGAIARTAGINVLQSGTQLTAPDGRYNYDVAAACSGVRSLTAMVALVVLAGYLNFRSWRRRALVLLLCFPLVYLGNVARIASIIFAGQLGGQTWGERMHDVMGFGVFAIVLGGVLAAISAMQKWWPESEKKAEVEVPVASETEGASGAGNPSPLRRAGSTSITVAVGVSVLAMGEMAFLHHLATSPARGQVGITLTADGRDPVELPSLIGIAWAGQASPVSTAEREILPADTGYSRKLYKSLDRFGRDVFFSIVLSGRDRTSIHRPELCLIAQGWTIMDRTETRFRFPAALASAAGAGDFPATVLKVQREIMTPRGKVVHPEYFAYWFIGGDEIVASHWERVARDAWNRVRHGRADRWAYVIMQTDASEGEAAALARMQSVLDGALLVFQPRVAAR